MYTCTHVRTEQAGADDKLKEFFPLWRWKVIEKREEKDEEEKEQAEQQQEEDEGSVSACLVTYRGM